MSWSLSAASCVLSSKFSKASKSNEAPFSLLSAILMDSIAALFYIFCIPWVVNWFVKASRQLWLWVQYALSPRLEVKKLLHPGQVGMINIVIQCRLWRDMLRVCVTSQNSQNLILKRRVLATKNCVMCNLFLRK
jgi:hypothetical protein